VIALHRPGRAAVTWCAPPKPSASAAANRRQGTPWPEAVGRPGEPVAAGYRRRAGSGAARALRSLEQAYAEREKTESGSFTGQYVQHFLIGEAIPGIAFDYARAQAMLPSVSLTDLNALAKQWLAGAPVILVNTPGKNRAAVPSPETLLGLFAGVKRAEIAAYVETVSEAALVPGRLAAAVIASGQRIQQYLGGHLPTACRLFSNHRLQAGAGFCRRGAPAGFPRAGQPAHQRALAPAHQREWCQRVQRGRAAEKARRRGVEPLPSSGLNTARHGRAASPKMWKRFSAGLSLRYTSTGQRGHRHSWATSASRSPTGARAQGSLQDTLAVTVMQHHPE
jgi:zinc protease